jgi:hypothetical protein
MHTRGAGRSNAQSPGGTDGIHHCGARFAAHLQTHGWGAGGGGCALAGGRCRCSAARSEASRAGAVRACRCAQVCAPARRIEVATPAHRAGGRPSRQRQVGVQPKNVTHLTRSGQRGDKTKRKTTAARWRSPSRRRSRPRKSGCRRSPARQRSWPGCGRCSRRWRQ